MRFWSALPGSRPLLLAFVLVAVVQVSLVASSASPWDSLAKCLLAPLLGAWVVSAHGPRLLVAALLFCLIGDFCLEFEALFLPGMLAFAAAHGCLITLFARTAGARPRWTTCLPLALVLAAGLVWLWSGLDPALRVPVVVYGVILTTMAAFAITLGPTTGVGGLLFLLSDGLIAADLAGRLTLPANVHGVLVMSTYIAAIGLLAVGCVCYFQEVE